MGYAFIDHTADVAADLTGSTPGELFRAAAHALTDTITELGAVQPAVTQSVTLDAGSLEDLLVDWLNELLYRFEVQNLLVCDASVTPRQHDGRWYLEGTVAGETFDPMRHPSRVLVKSATYHGLNVIQEHGAWKARIVLDI
jgi:SHS2 domain-containing protein